VLLKKSKQPSRRRFTKLLTANPDKLTQPKKPAKKIIAKKFPQIKEPLSILIGKKPLERHIPIEEFEETIERNNLEKLAISLEKINVDYDEEADVLYMRLGKPREAKDSVEVEDGVIYRIVDKEVTGITIIDFKTRMHRSKTR